MLESIPVVFAVSTLLGFLSGIGIGGGSLLVLWLTLVLDRDPATARTMNLLFFLPAAGVSSFFRWRQGVISPKDLALPAVVGCGCAALASFLSMRLSLGLLKKLFGGLLILTGVRELFYRPKK